MASPATARAPQILFDLGDHPITERHNAISRVTIGQLGYRDIGVIRVQKEIETSPEYEGIEFKDRLVAVVTEDRSYVNIAARIAGAVLLTIATLGSIFLFANDFITNLYTSTQVTSYVDILKSIGESEAEAASVDEEAKEDAEELGAGSTLSAASEVDVLDKAEQERAEGIVRIANIVAKGNPQEAQVAARETFRDDIAADRFAERSRGLRGLRKLLANVRRGQRVAHNFREFTRRLESERLSSTPRVEESAEVRAKRIAADREAAIAMLSPERQKAVRDRLLSTLLSADIM